MLNVIINTCCMTEDPLVAANTGSYGAGRRTYRDRQDNLADMIECYSLQPGVDVVVVGEYKPGPGYTYIEDPGLTHSPEDQAQQRYTAEKRLQDHGADQPTLYLNDDHYFPVEDIGPAIDTLQEWNFLGWNIGVMAFRRRDYAGRRMIDGCSGGAHGLKDYVMGHGHLATFPVVMRALWGAVVPTPGVGTGLQADIQFTGVLAAADVKWRRGPFTLIDMEEGAFPW
jgi:hypothetical protein